MKQKIQKKKYALNEQKIKEQKVLIDTTSLITDDVLKNALLAYNSISNRNDARDIVIAYLKSKGKEDLISTIEEKKD